MDVRMYDTMTSIPLFLGMNAQDLHTVIEKANMTILLVETGETLAMQGEACKHLYILLNGKMSVLTQTTNNTFSVEEILEGNVLLEPDSLYGIGRKWKSTYRAATDCHVMSIEKESVGRLIAGFEIFRINFMNLLCTLSTRRQIRQWQLPPMNTKRRLLHFLSTHTQCQTSGRKVYHTRMEDLGTFLGITRSLVGQLLAELQDEGLLTYSRNIIEIHDIKQINNHIYGTA